MYKRAKLKYQIYMAVMKMRYVRYMEKCPQKVMPTSGLKCDQTKDPIKRPQRMTLQMNLEGDPRRGPYFFI